MFTASALRRTGYFNERHIDPRFRKGLVFAGLGAHPGSRIFRDSSGRHNHGTLEPDFATGPTWLWDAELGRHVTQYDGSDDYITVPHSASFLFGTGDFTIAVWFNRSNNGIMLGKDTNTDRQWILTFAFTTGFKLSFISIPDGPLQLNGATDVLSGVWYHGAVTRRAGTLTIYLDGIADGTAASSAAINGTNDINIGRREFPGFPDSFIGSLSDPLIYSRALSPAEIAWLADPTNRLVQGRDGVVGRVVGNRRRRTIICGRAA